MEFSFDALPDDVLMQLLIHAGPCSPLRMCSRSLRCHGNDSNLWRIFVENAGINPISSEEVNENSAEGSICSWIQVYKKAKVCSHARLIRDFRFKSSAKESPDFRLFISSHKHLPMKTTCQCGICRRDFTLVVKPHFDPVAIGLRMEDIEFCSMRGDLKRWTERWYMIGESMYSIKGGEDQSLDECETVIKYETTTNSFASMVRM